MVRIAFLLFVASSLLRAQTPFSLDHARTYFHTLAVEIGARPMGSPQERRAMEFALGKFREFGLDEAYLLEMTSVPGTAVTPPTNTRSGTAVGILRGRNERIIVLGAHIDSADPDVPGANDNASGSAVIIELARVLSQRANESTIVFALFGGEEQGLRGSRHFVQNFPLIDRVVLMLQVDMANGVEWLLPTLDTKTRSAPAWLVRASYEEFRRLGFTGLRYPTHFFALMDALPGGGVGSDHQPFLDADIPAIDFTTDPRDPIHTPQDSYENFKPEGLKRSGDLILRLVERFDDGVPPLFEDPQGGTAERTGRYLLLQIGSKPLFIPIWGVVLFIVASLVVSVIALRALRARRQPVDTAERAKIPGLKLFLLMLIIQTCIWLSENVVGLVKGERHPWLADLSGYYLLAVLAALVGVWFSLTLASRLHWRPDAYSYYLRAAILLVVFVAISSLSSAKLALYPASALFILSLAMLARPVWLKVILWLFSPYLMFRLFFPDSFEFLARVVASSPDMGVASGTVLTLFLIFFFSLYFLPFLLGFAALYANARDDFRWLKQLRRPVGLLVPIGGFVIVVVVLAGQASYSNEWRPTISMKQLFDADSSSGVIVIKGSEYLHGTRLRLGPIDTILTGRRAEARFENIPRPPAAWVSAERRTETDRRDTVTTFNILLKVRTLHRPYTLTVSYSAGRRNLRNASSVVAFGSSDRSMTLRWYSFPDSLLFIPVTLTVGEGDSLTERIEATFVEEAVPVVVDREGVNMIRRTVITQQSVLRGSSP